MTQLNCYGNCALKPQNIYMGPKDRHPLTPFSKIILRQQA